MKRALICGISGQDGSYLAQLLLAKSYTVFGGSRDAQLSGFRNLALLGIRDRVQVVSVNPQDFRSALHSITKLEPDEIYNLSGQSSVGLSFEQPVETMESISMATLNLLEAIRFSGKAIRFYNAGSGECFGNTGSHPADEQTPFRPASPYAVAKAAAYWQVVNYRESYDLFACTGILFNHESPLRPQYYVTQKIVSGAVRIAQGGKEKLRLGNMAIQRDWGWAPEYVDAMWRLLQNEKPEDFVVATGETRKLEEFVDAAFAHFGLRWRDYVELDRSLLRPSDLETGRANPRKAEERLGWKARYKMQDVVRMMIEGDLQAAGAPLSGATSLVRNAVS